MAVFLAQTVAMLHTYDKLMCLTDLDPMGAIIVRTLSPPLPGSHAPRGHPLTSSLAPSSAFTLSRMFRFTEQIAAGVIVAWNRTVYKQFELLAGKSAPHDFLQLLIYKAMTFSDEIDQVDTVRAYHVRPSSFLASL